MGSEAFWFPFGVVLTIYIQVANLVVTSEQHTGKEVSAWISAGSTPDILPLICQRTNGIAGFRGDNYNGLTHITGNLPTKNKLHRLSVVEGLCWNLSGLRIYLLVISPCRFFTPPNRCVVYIWVNEGMSEISGSFRTCVHENRVKNLNAFKKALYL